MTLRDRIGDLAAVAATLLAATAVWFRLTASSPEAGIQQGGRQLEKWEPLAQRGPRLGPSTARVVIVEFADFQCSYCKKAAVILREIRRRYPADVALVYRHLPLSERTLDAAIASECAERDGRFEAMHDLLFLESELIGTRPWGLFGVEAGITDTAGLRICMRTPGPSEGVWRDIHVADSLGVGETPTLLINGRVVVGSPDLERLDDYVRSLLGR